MNGWVIVYLPGGAVYDMLEAPQKPGKKSFHKRLLRRGIKTFLAVAQLYWWIKT